MSEPNANAAQAKSEAAQQGEAQQGSQVTGAEQQGSQGAGGEQQGGGEEQPVSKVAAAAKAVANAEADAASAAWYESLPAEAHAKLKDFASLEDALGAIEKGAKYTTAKSVKDYNIDLGPELNGQEDGGALDDFKNFCFENDISPEAAQKLVTYQMGKMSEAQKQLIEVGQAQLKKMWGNSYTTNSEKGFVALSILDRKMGGRLAPAFKQSGLVDDPIVVEALYEISTMIGEESLGAGGPGAAPQKPVSAEDAYKQLYAKKSGA